MLAACARSRLTLLVLTALLLLFLLNLWHSSPDGWSQRVGISRPYPHATKRPLPNPALPYSAVILYLASTFALEPLTKSLDLLNQNLPTRIPWPIILFHTGDYDDPAARQKLFDTLHEKIGLHRGSADLISRIEFEKLEWKLPPGIPNDVKLVDPVFAFRWPGYHHMCDFYATKIFDHPRLQNVDFYLRLDTDSYIESPACYDPLEIMYEQNLTYGYRAIGFDAEWATKGMWSLVDDYSRSHPEIEQRMVKNAWKWPKDRVKEKMLKEFFPGYYNNFEIVRLEAFRTPQIREWFAEIVSVPERIYKYRWGDAPLRFATVNMFFDIKTQAKEFCGIPYYHQFKIPSCACNATSSTSTSVPIPTTPATTTLAS